MIFSALAGMIAAGNRVRYHLGAFVVLRLPVGCLRRSPFVTWVPSSFSVCQSDAFVVLRSPPYILGSPVWDLCRFPFASRMLMSFSVRHFGACLCRSPYASWVPLVVLRSMSPSPFAIWVPLNTYTLSVRHLGVLRSPVGYLRRSPFATWVPSSFSVRHPTSTWVPLSFSVRHPTFSVRHLDFAILRVSIILYQHSWSFVL